MAIARSLPATDDRKLMSDQTTKHAIPDHVPLRKGDVVLISTYLTSRDPRRYDNPHVIESIAIRAP